MASKILKIVCRPCFCPNVIFETNRIVNMVIYLRGVCLKYKVLSSETKKYFNTALEMFFHPMMPTRVQ